MRHPHKVADEDDLLHHLMEDHDQHFMTTSREPEDPEAALQHLCDMHARLHEVKQGETENLHYDLMSGRWRYNDGKLAESTDDGPVRHRAPVVIDDLADEETGETLADYLIGPLIEPVQVEGDYALAWLKRKLHRVKV